MGNRTKGCSLVAVAVALLLAACPPPKGRRAGDHGTATVVDADACGEISTSKVGRRVHSFLVASAELDRASAELEGSVRGACKRMADELGVTATGDTRTICNAALAALKENLQVSVRQETRMVTRYTPPECHTEVDFAASVVAECEATVAADVDVRCEGTCGGTCSGACDGRCEGGGGGGECNGRCDGTCNGRCEGQCNGYADVQASAECKAAAEVRASLHTECTEPKVEVVQEQVTVVDDAKFQKAMKAIETGMPTILRVGAKAELVAKAVVQWAATLGRLVKASGELVEQLGEKGVCVGGQIALAFAAATQIEARVQVSVEVSVDVQAAAGASAN